VNVIGWRVWYADGSVHDSASQTWDSLLASGFQVAILYYDQNYTLADGTTAPYRRIIMGNNFYFISSAAVADGSTFAQADVTPTPGQIGDALSVKQGTTVSALTYAQILSAALGAAVAPIVVAPPPVGLVAKIKGVFGL
jgi:hypothetical protein